MITAVGPLISAPFSGDIPSPVNYVNDYVDRYKVIYTNELAYEKPEGVWNPADKHWDFPEDALTISDKRNVNKLLQIPDACKIIDFKEITRTKYGYIVRNFWRNNNKETITKQLNYITELCEALDIPYTDAQVRFGSAQGWMWWIQVFKDELSRQQAISERTENMSKPSDDPSDQNDYIMNLPEDPDAALCVLQVGDRVNHDKLGEGTVVKVFDKDIVAVEFDSGKKHSILATHPKLHKLLQGTC